MIFCGRVRRKKMEIRKTRKRKERNKGGKNERGWKEKNENSKIMIKERRESIMERKKRKTEKHK